MKPIKYINSFLLICMCLTITACPSPDTVDEDNGALVGLWAYTNSGNTEPDLIHFRDGGRYTYYENVNLQNGTYRDIWDDTYVYNASSKTLRMVEFDTDVFDYGNVRVTDHTLTMTYYGVSKDFEEYYVRISDDQIPTKYIGW